jgi:hypothetical protein
MKGKSLNKAASLQRPVVEQVEEVIDAWSDECKRDTDAFMESLAAGFREMGLDPANLHLSFDPPKRNAK